jgi:ADP-L-glycero-D-manno-heptose 6-epimerase
MHNEFFNVKESGVSNVGTGELKSFLEVAMEVAERYNAKIMTIPFPQRLKDHYQYYTCADMTKLNNTFMRNINSMKLRK